MNGQLIFVSSDNSTGKLGVDDRQLIRSRCMQGVNKKESSRRSLRASRRAARLPHPAQEYRVTSRHEPGAKVTADAVDPADLTTHSVSHDYPVAHSRGLDLEILQFIHQDTVLYPREFTFNCRLSISAVSRHIILISCTGIVTAFKQVKAIISPLFNSLYFDDMEDDGYQWLVNDTPFRHAIVLMVSAYRECSAEGHLSAMSRSHHHATVNSLNKRLSSTPEHFLIDTTIFIINVLATVAAWLGRHDEFTVHMRGLGQVVRLRGGKDFLYRRPFIRYHLQW
jgi:hypothetical protein